ncbi:hypothetical protein Q5752_000977 [Cryptotrichosporon argae]
MLPFPTTTQYAESTRIVSSSDLWSASLLDTTQPHPSSTSGAPSLRHTPTTQHDAAPCLPTPPVQTATFAPMPAVRPPFTGQGPLTADWVNPAVDLPTGDRFSELLKAKLDMDLRQSGDASGRVDFGGLGAAMNLPGRHEHPVPWPLLTSPFDARGGSACGADRTRLSTGIDGVADGIVDMIDVSRNAIAAMDALSAASRPAAPHSSSAPMPAPADPPSALAHLALEHALHDTSRVWIPPDLVAPVPPHVFYPFATGASTAAYDFGIGCGLLPISQSGAQPDAPATMAGQEDSPSTHASSGAVPPPAPASAGLPSTPAPPSALPWNWLGGDVLSFAAPQPFAGAPQVSPFPTSVAIPQPQLSVALPPMEYMPQAVWHGLGGLPVSASTTLGDTPIMTPLPKPEQTASPAGPYSGAAPAFTLPGPGPGAWAHEMFPSAPTTLGGSSSGAGSPWAVPAAHADDTAAPGPSRAADMTVSSSVELSTSGEHVGADAGAKKPRGKKRKSEGEQAAASSAAAAGVLDAEGEEKKIVIACYTCRQRKLKCDGERPRCAHCKRRPQDICEYDAVLRRRGPGRNNKPRDKARGARRKGGGKLGDVERAVEAPAAMSELADSSPARSAHQLPARQLLHSADDAHVSAGGMGMGIGHVVPSASGLYAASSFPPSAGPALALPDADADGPAPWASAGMHVMAAAAAAMRADR